MSENDKLDYIYKSTIKETYGLTEGWIKRIGEPDRVVTNPHYSSRKAYLYLRARVEAFIDEHQEEYKELLAKRAGRPPRPSRREQEWMTWQTWIAEQRTKELAVRAEIMANPQAQELMAWAENVAIEIAGLSSREELVQDMKRDGYSITDQSMAAHVRHRRTNYEQLLHQIEGKPGCHYAYLILRERTDALVNEVLAAI